MTQVIAQAEAFFANGATLAAWGAAAVSIPIAIHLLTRLQRVNVPWGAMRFLLEVYRRHRTRLQLEQLILLLVRCLILAVLGMALAGPLLGGCAKGLGIEGARRTVCIVIDDSLSARATVGGAKARFENLLDIASDLLDTLEPTDQVAIWQAGHPTIEAMVPASLDRAGARNNLQNMSPRYGKSDLPGTLRSVGDYLAKQDQPKDQVFVFVLSDFAEDALPADVQNSAEAARIGKYAKLLVSPPAEPLGNVQIASLQPRRHTIVVSPQHGPVSIPMSVKLRRFVTEGTEQSTRVHLYLHVVEADAVTNPDEPPAPLLGPIVREFRWSPGQVEGGWDNLEIQLDGLEDQLVSNDPGSAGAASGTRLVVQATIGEDALVEDNARTAIVELRSQLRVGLIDEDADADDRDSGLTPGQWMTLALRVGGNEVVDLPATDVDAKTLSTLDGVVVMRPDLLGETDWKSLREVADRGGLVWVNAPAAAGDVQWGERFTAALGFDWQLGFEPPAADSTPKSMALDTDTSVPEPLERLSADWQALLRPVAVMQSIDLTIRNGGDVVTWLRTEEGNPLLATAEVGDGMVCLLTSAIHKDWSNLALKPLFVPLVNETLLGVVGNAGESIRLSKVVCGDRPMLGRGWEGAQKIVRVQGKRVGWSIPLQRDDAGFLPIKPLEEPGVYAASPSVGGRKLSVNVDPDAGNTRAVDDTRLRDWLSSLGTWEFLDEENPAQAMMAQVSRTNIGWHLLWIVLALGVIELCLARWFSHAKQEASAKPQFNRILGQVLGAQQQ